MKLTWYGHSCFLLETAEGSVVFDPYAPGSVPGWTLPELTADAVICSHGHRDHGYADGVKLTGSKPAFKVQQLATYHDDAKGALRGENTVTLMESEGIRLVHLGDLGHELDAQQIAALGRVDVLLLPVGGFYTIDAPTAKKVAAALQPRVIVPMHYRGEGFGYDVIGTLDAFAELSENVRYINGSTLELTQPLDCVTAVLKA